MRAEFPLDALPKPLADLARAASKAGNYPPEFVAMPGLSVMAAAIGGRAIAEITPQFVGRAILWTAMAGPASSGKGPGQRVATAPLVRLQRDWERGYAEARERYEADLRDYAVAITKLGRGDERPPEPDEPTQPRRCLITEATLESLAGILRTNPAGGLLWQAEELVGTLASLDQYRPGGRGAGRQTFLSLHDGEPLQRARVLTTAYAAHPERFVRKPPVPPRLPEAAWINRPAQEVA